MMSFVLLYVRFYNEYSGSLIHDLKHPRTYTRLKFHISRRMLTNGWLLNSLKHWRMPIILKNNNNKKRPVIYAQEIKNWYRFLFMKTEHKNEWSFVKSACLTFASSWWDVITNHKIKGFILRVIIHAKLNWPSLYLCCWSTCKAGRFADSFRVSVTRLNRKLSVENVRAIWMT